MISENMPTSINWPDLQRSIPPLVRLRRLFAMILALLGSHLFSLVISKYNAELRLVETYDTSWEPLPQHAKRLE